MKKVTTIALMMLFGLSLSFIGCKKYQEGPALSLATKKGRIKGTWAVTKSFSEGVEDDCDSDCIKSRSESTTEYMKDDKYTSTWVAVAGGVTLSTTVSTGKWTLSADKTSILIDPDDDDPDVGYFWSAYILKLKGKEMWTGTPTEKGTDPKYYTIMEQE